MQRIDKRQLNFVFAESSDGKEGGPTHEPSELGAREWLLHKANGKETKETITEVTESNRLLERVASELNLAKALRKVATNKGAAGVDGKSVGEVVQNVRSLLPKLRYELLKGKYRPGEVRRVWIPKPGGGQRGLGIPNVIDRWVQQALLQVLEPIWEPTFHTSSHGFRPGRGTHTAIREAKKYVAEGYSTVVDIDLSKFFDRVNHQRLLGRMSQRVKDGGILKLVHRMLKAKVVMPDGTRIGVEEGTPQGGPLSPLLSNIVLDELDRELERRGLRFVRYADDSNIYVGSVRSGERVMNSTRKFIEKRLRLKINEEKSLVTSPDKMHFLGFRLRRTAEGEVEVQLSERSRKRMNERIVKMTPRNWGHSLKDCIERLNGYLRGWGEYFRLCTAYEASSFRRFDGHIRRRLRAIIIKQRKRGRYLLNHLVSRGVPRGAAAGSAYGRRGIWRRSLSYGMHRGYGNAWFSERLVSLGDILVPRSSPVRVTDQQLDLLGLW